MAHLFLKYALGIAKPASQGLNIVEALPMPREAGQTLLVRIGEVNLETQE